MKYFKLIPFSIAIFFLVSSFCYPQNSLPTLKGKNIIFVYGGSIHSPKESADLFVPILEAEGAKVQVFDSFTVYEDQNLMNETDLIIQAFTDFFTPVFVMARITGWSAHIMEQHTANKLIRPLSKYKGNEHREVLALNIR